MPRSLPCCSACEAHSTNGSKHTYRLLRLSRALYGAQLSGCPAQLSGCRSVTCQSLNCANAWRAWLDAGWTAPLAASMHAGYRAHIEFPKRQLTRCVVRAPSSDSFTHPWWTRTAAPTWTRCGRASKILAAAPRWRGRRPRAHQSPRRAVRRSAGHDPSQQRRTCHSGTKLPEAATCHVRSHPPPPRLPPPLAHAAVRAASVHGATFGTA